MDAGVIPVNGFAGGALIGLSAVLLLIANGRIAGVSGILGGLLTRKSHDMGWRIAFIVGLWLGALVYWVARGQVFEVQTVAPWPVIVLGGVLVGLGTRIGSGCTSGHGICGIARLSKRSIVATLVFMAAGIVTVYVTRHVFGF